MTPVRGDIWLFDFGMAEKVRPALVISVAFGDADRALGHHCSSYDQPSRISI